VPKALDPLPVDVPPPLPPGTLPGTIENEGVGPIPTIHGNPGPQLRFDHRHNKALVPHYSIIQ
jgi:hypothetical protein